MPGQLPSYSNMGSINVDINRVVQRCCLNQFHFIAWQATQLQEFDGKYTVIEFPDNPTLSVFKVCYCD
jgi:hypothetical protein